MLVQLALIFAASGALALPPPAQDEPFFRMLPLTDDVPQALSAADTLLKYLGAVQSEQRIKQKRVAFKYYYVSQRSYSRVRTGTSLEVAATSKVGAATHAKAARLIYLMVRYMPASIFKALCSRGRVGIFTKPETTTVYSEYARYADRAECKGRCDGSCRNTCTGDGRKYSTIAGLGGLRATAVAVNVDCYSGDPYNKRFNVLVHEFAHTVHWTALDMNWKFRITAAYRTAKSRCTWQCSSYGMSNHLEYFAEGTTAWFMASKQQSSGGMNYCTTSYCNGEMSARDNLRRKDFALFQALNYVWNNNRNDVASGIRGVCDW